MRVLILGSDGYLGWPLVLRLIKRGHEVSGADNLFTRKAVKEVGSDSALPIGTTVERVNAVRQKLGGKLEFYNADITNYAALERIIKKTRPETIVHFAEQRSAPYSMIDVEHAAYTLRNNLCGTINLIYAAKKLAPKAHIVKMGTLGEFGTPNFDIPESAFVNVTINGRSDDITIPKFAGSWYHWSKVHDTNNMIFANKLWGITMTDIMQGPVYGTRSKEITDDSLFTRFDFDEVWGTVLNRYCAEAVLGMPLTPYGKGGQTRGFLSLEDSMESLARLIQNPPENGGYRAVNQFTQSYSVNELADIVKKEAEELDLEVSIKSVANPRVEKEAHYYNPERKVLPDLGIKKPSRNIGDEVERIIKDLIPNKKRIAAHRKAIMPRTKWRSR